MILNQLFYKMPQITADIIFIAILVFFIIVGLSRGALKEFLVLLTTVFGIYLALKFHRSYYGVIDTIIQNKEISQMVSFILIALFANFLGNIFVKTILVSVKIGSSRFSSRLIGGVLGFFNGLCYITVIYFVIAGYIPDLVDKIKVSEIAPFLEKIVTNLHFYTIQNPLF